MNLSAALPAGRPLAALILVLAVIFAFEVWMFVDAIRNPHLSDNARLLWLIGMLLVHPLVAIVYFFIEFQKR